MLVRTKKECLKCKREISLSNYTKHYTACTGVKKNSIEIKSTWKQSSGKYKCPYCAKDYDKRGIGSHIWRMHTEEGKQHNPNEAFMDGSISRVAWNKGLTKETDKRVKNYAVTLREKYKTGEHPNIGREFSDEHRSNISKSRIKFLKENPDKMPYVLYHYTKGPSYPEVYFKELFTNEAIELKYHHRLSIYELDFAHLDKKIAIEIDGEQHYTDPRIIESDKRRDNFLKEKGWYTYRIRWADWQKKSYEDKRLIITEIKKLLTKH